MTLPTREELDAAWMHYHQRYLTDLIIFCLGFACRLEPDRLRDALKEAFSTEAVEEMAKRAITVASVAQLQMNEVRSNFNILQEEIKRHLDDTEKRLDGLNEYLDRLRAKFSSIVKTSSPMRK